MVIVKSGGSEMWPHLFTSSFRKVSIVISYYRSFCESALYITLTACTCTASSFSLTHPTQVIHIQPPPFRKNSYPSYSSCSSERCSVNRQPTQSVHLTLVHAALESASISVCSGCICAPLPSSPLRPAWTKWPQQLLRSLGVINWIYYHQE